MASSSLLFVLLLAPVVLHLSLAAHPVLIRTPPVPGTNKQRLGGDCVNATDCIPGMRCLYRRKRVFDIRTGLCVCPAIEVWNGSICQEDPCRVAVGGACSCPNGYAKVQNPRTGQVFNYMCTDMQDSCQPSPCPYRCIDTSEGPVCRVRRGYLSRGNMLQDIDECAVSQAIRNKPACPGNGTCTNLKGTYACSCASGYSWSASAGMGTMGACVDINECVVKTASCGTSARCINTVGGYSCHCNDGFTGRHPNCRLAISLPQPTPSCLTSSQCSAGAECRNFDSHVVGGPMGFCYCTSANVWNGSSCVPDPCRNATNMASCACPFWYSRKRSPDGSYNCVATPQCVYHTCSASEVCVSKPGGYNCICKQGLRRGSKGCVNPDECAHFSSLCPLNSVCVNTQYSYQCNCRSGYTGDSGQCVAIVDRCLATPCSANGTCVKFLDSYRCTCNAGFVGNGTWCLNLNHFFCPSETFDSVGFGKIQWPQTKAGSRAQVNCPSDNPNALTGFGMRHCVSIAGRAVWESPSLWLCPVEDVVAQRVTNLTSSLISLKSTWTGIVDSTYTLNMLSEILENSTGRLEVTSMIAVANLLEFISHQPATAMDKALDGKPDAPPLTADVIHNSTLELLQRVATVATQISKSVRNLNQSERLSFGVDRFTRSLERLVQSAPIKRADVSVMVNTEFIAISAVCPSTIAKPFVVNWSPSNNNSAALSVSLVAGSGNKSNGSESLIFKMPAEVLALAYKQDNGSASRFDCQRPKVSFIVYNNALLFQDSALQDLNMQAVGSKIISAKVGLSLESLQLVDTEILITFPSSKMLPLPQCSFWNRNATGWSDTGCRLVSQTGRAVTCACNHLTNFAVLFMPPEAGKNSTTHERNLMVISTVGCSMSICGLFVAVIVGYAIRSMQERLLFKTISTLLSLTLLITLVTFMITSNFHAAMPADLCRVLGMAQHLTLLLSFGWMMVQAVLVYKNLVIVFSSDIDFLKRYSLFVVAVSCAIVGLTAIVSKMKAYDPAHLCWFSSKSYFLPSLVVPLVVMVVCNSSILVVVSVSLSRDANVLRKITLLKIIRIIFSLSLVVGTTWILGALLPFVNSIALQYAFALLVSTQGFMIFVVNIVMAPEVMDRVRNSLSATRTAVKETRHRSNAFSSGCRQHGMNRSSFCAVTTSEKASWSSWYLTRVHSFEDELQMSPSTSNEALRGSPAFKRSNTDTSLTDLSQKDRCSVYSNIELSHLDSCASRAPLTIISSVSSDKTDRYVDVGKSQPEPSRELCGPGVLDSSATRLITPSRVSFGTQYSGGDESVTMGRMMRSQETVETAWPGGAAELVTETTITRDVEKSSEEETFQKPPTQQSDLRLNERLNSCVSRLLNQTTKNQSWHSSPYSDSSCGGAYSGPRTSAAYPSTSAPSDINSAGDDSTGLSAMNTTGVMDIYPYDNDDCFLPVSVSTVMPSLDTSTVPSAPGEEYLYIAPTLNTTRSGVAQNLLVSQLRTSASESTCTELPVSVGDKPRCVSAEPDTKTFLMRQVADADKGDKGESLSVGSTQC